MEHNNRFRTLAEAVNVLQRAGYTDELVLTEQGLQKGTEPLDPADFRIDSFHRFEGPSDPADMSIVYAVSSARLGIKGLLIGAYGALSNSVIHRMVQPLDAHHPEERHVRPVEPIAPGASGKV
ncbi:MAG TPA: phosphoribosylpyrophosphate synthetase [Flavobacteriales bacterium]|jgi:hypothetical protein|nr:phosphoribosylpyrophosphate synthetase [Flavobacteriales bacterium]